MGEEDIQPDMEKVKRIETSEFRRARDKPGEEDPDSILAEPGFKINVQEEDEMGGLIRRWETMSPVSVQEIHNKVGEGTFQIKKLLVKGMKRDIKALFKIKLGPRVDAPPFSGIKGVPSGLGDPQGLALLLTPFVEMMKEGFNRMETAIKENSGGGKDSQALQLSAMQAQLTAQSSIVQPLFSFLGEKHQTDANTYAKGQRDAQVQFRETLALVKGEEEETDIIELFKTDPKAALAEIQRDPELLDSLKGVWKTLKGFFGDKEDGEEETVEA